MTLPVEDPVSLADRLTPAAAHLVALDFDGTLSHIVDRPDDAVPAPGAVEALAALARVTDVALVSGRPVAELEARFPGVVAHLVGGHGAELVDTDGRQHHLVDLEEVADTLDTVEAALRELVDDEPGWFVERKRASLAVHHRLAAEDSVEAHLPRIQALLDHHAAGPPAFAVLAGKAVVELRPASIDKGRALAALLDRHPERRPLMLGDDVTDEDAFRVALDRGGTAVLVADAPRPTAATHRLLDPDAVVAFLDALARSEG